MKVYRLTMDSGRGLTNLDLIEHAKKLELDISEASLYEMHFRGDLNIKNVGL